MLSDQRVSEREAPLLGRQKPLPRSAVRRQANPAPEVHREEKGRVRVVRLSAAETGPGE